MFLRGGGLIRFFILNIIFFPLASLTHAQNTFLTSDTSQYLTLKQCIDYALTHQPALNRSLINVDITKTTNAINLAGWYPQVAITGNFNHYLQRPTSFFTTTDSTGAATSVRQRVGVVNTVTPELTVTQALFSPSLLYANKAAPLYVKQAQQITDSTKINVVASVTKAFYNLLLTLEQINVYKTDTVRLRQNVTDTYHQYVGGIVDETDNDQAIISLNNAKAQLKQASENVVPQYATLKQFMGYPPQQQFNISFDTLEMMNNINFDTTQQLQYEKRIELQQVQTSKELQHQLTRYYQYSALPTLSAFYDHNFVFQSNTYSNLFAQSYPNSLIGLSLDLPIFTGFARVNSVKRSRLQEKQIEWNEVSLKSQIYTEYTTALANYKSNLYNLKTLQDNVGLANKVYFIVNMQYKQGLVPYLNVITAESSLITSQINYTNALFQLLSSKVDLQKAMGIISY